MLHGFRSAFIKALRGWVKLLLVGQCGVVVDYLIFSRVRGWFEVVESCFGVGGLFDWKVVHLCVVCNHAVAGSAHGYGVCEGQWVILKSHNLFPLPAAMSSHYSRVPSHHP